MRLSLVIPCYNEAKNIPLLLERCKEGLSRNDIEVILVDNGSVDDTPAVLNSLIPNYGFARSIRVEQNQGYGFGITSGLKVASGEILAWTHADMQTDPLDALKGLEYFKNEDVSERLFVKGRRFGRPLADVVFTVGMSVFEMVLLRKGLWDINAQPTMFARSFFETWQDPPFDFSLDLYAYYMARRGGLKVKRFPVKFGERAFGSSHWNVDWKSKLKFIKRTFEYSIQLSIKMKKSK